MKNIIRIFSLAILIIVMLVTVALAEYFQPPVQAASFDLKDGCETIGTIGTVIVARCYDEETDAVLYGNSVGWMSNPIY